MRTTIELKKEIITKFNNGARVSEAGCKNINTEVESIGLLSMERWPVQTRKQPKSTLTNSVTS